MKKILILTLIVAIFSCSKKEAAIPDTISDSGTKLAASKGTYQWRQLPDFIEPRILATAFTIGEKAYMGMGETQSSIYPWGVADRADLWEFDPKDGIWNPRASLPGCARSSAVSFSIGGKGYIGLGLLLKDFWEYDPSTNKWCRKADFPGEVRDNAISFSIDKMGYVGTGYVHEKGERNDLWQFDPARNKWERRANVPGPIRQGAVAFTICDRAYVGMGFSGETAIGLLCDLYEYDPKLDRWFSKADFPEKSVYRPSSFTIQKKAFLVGGFGSVGYSKDIWIYDSESNTWSKIQDGFPSWPRAEGVAFSIGKKGYFGLGSNYAGIPVFRRLKDMWEFSEN